MESGAKNYDVLMKDIQSQLKFMNLYQSDLLETIKKFDKDNITYEQLYDAVLNYYYNIIRINYYNSDYSFIHNYIKQNIFYTGDIEFDLKLVSNLFVFLDKLPVEIDLAFLEIIVNRNDELKKIINNLSSKTSCTDLSIFFKSQNIIDLLEEFFNINEFNRKLHVNKLAEERILIEKYQKEKDNQAVIKLIENYEKLIKSIALKYIGRGLDLEDLQQEGTLGFIKAIQKFDLNKNSSLSTVAFYWVRQAISRAIYDTGKIVRLPVSKEADLYKFRKCITNLSLVLGRAPTTKEIATKLKLPEKEVEQLMKEANISYVSLNTFIDDDKSTELGDFIPDDSQNVEDAIDTHLLKNEISIILSSLNEKERNILVSLFGLDGTEPKALEKIGKTYNVTRERIRQIKEKALKKLRKNPKVESLKIYYDGSAFNGFIPDEGNIKKEKTPKVKSPTFNDRVMAVDNNFSINLDGISHECYFSKSPNDILRSVYTNILSNNYKKARNILELIEDKDSLDYLRIISILEEIENNYVDSFEYQSKIFKYPEMQFDALFDIARLNIQLGQNDIGRKMYETLLNNEKFRGRAQLNTIYLDVLENEINHAKKIFSDIDLSNLDSYLMNEYKVIANFLKYKTGINDNISSYINVSLDKYDDIVERIKHTKDFYNKNYDSLFSKYISFKLLIDDIREQIASMNGNHFKIWDFYRLKLDCPVGLVGGEPTSDITVVTGLGSKEIVTMYPILLSDKYDLDNNLSSGDLKIKRMSIRGEKHGKKI